MGRTYSCWMLNWRCITWPVGFKGLIIYSNLHVRATTNFRRQKGDMNQTPFRGPKDIRRLHRKFRHHCDLLSEICVPQLYNSVLCFGQCKRFIVIDIRHSIWPKLLMNTWAVRKVSFHFEYIENRSRNLDVTWQPVRGDLTVHPWTVALPWD